MTKIHHDTAISRFATLFNVYTKKSVQFEAKSSRSRDGKSEGNYVTTNEPVNFPAHLSGTLPSCAGIPLLDDGMSCQFGAIDIDEIGIDLSELARVTREFPLCVCESKSKGAHLYLFTEEPVPAVLIQRVLTEWADAIGYPNAEIFPKQVDRKLAKIGQAINFPYFGNTRKMVDENGQTLSLDKFLEEAERRVIGRPYLEMVQVIKSDNGFFVQGSYAGRNNFLNALGYKMIMSGESIEEVSLRLHHVNEEADANNHANFSEGPLPKGNTWPADILDRS